MYEGVSTRAQTHWGKTYDFPTTIGLHQDYALSSYLYTLILDTSLGNMWLSPDQK